MERVISEEELLIERSLAFLEVYLSQSVSLEKMDTIATSLIKDINKWGDDHV